MHQEPTPRIKVERIIALKRYEQPPPGYFHLLPSRIINRIERGEQPSGFWERFWPSFAVRPSLAYALGLTVFGTLAAGFFSPPARVPVLAAGDSEPGPEWAVVSRGEEESAETEQSHGLRASSSYRSTTPIAAPRTGTTFVNFQEAHSFPVSAYSQP